MTQSNFNSCDCDVPNVPGYNPSIEEEHGNQEGLEVDDNITHHFNRWQSIILEDTTDGRDIE